MTIARALFRTALALLLALAALPALAVTQIRGTTPGGAAYVIAVPDGWLPGGPLAFVNHGFNFELDDDPGLGALSSVQLAQGYAVAASGFRQRGWALRDAVEDNYELLQVFRERFGEPGQVLAFGGSMGGLITLKQAEDPRFSVSGAYALCAPAAGARAWDTALDLRLAYDAVCGGVPDSQLPIGSLPMPWALDLDDIPDDLGDLTQSEAVVRALVRVAACTGLFLPEVIRSPGQRQRMAQLMQLSGITSEDFLETNFGYAIFALSDLVRAPSSLGGRNPFDTRGVLFDLGPLESLVPRFAPDPFAQLDFARSSTLSGAGNHKILSMHTSRDELVRPQHQAEIELRYPPERRAQFVVSENEPTHCGFSGPEVLAGWEGLRAWVGGGPKPIGAALQAGCRNIVTAGIATGECRISDYVSANPAAELDTTMRPRPLVQQAEASARVAGLWFTPGRSGEGLFLEPQPDGRVIVTWYTFPAAGEPGEQLWLFGEGRITGAGFESDYLIRTEGGGFGGAFDPANVRSTPWGRVRIVFDGEDRAVMSFEGPPGYGSETRALTRLSQYRVPADPPTAGLGWQASGAWIDPARAGEGVFLHSMLAEPGDPWAERMFLVWYTYDANGRPAWLFAEGATPVDTSPPVPRYFDFQAVLRPVGTRFGVAFDEDDVQRRVVGRIGVFIEACDRIALSFTPGTGSEFPARELTLSRLSRAAGGSCSLPPTSPSPTQ